ncbi:SIMPL domain-containing protein [Microbulbifer sp. SAOS-129_SWC]|uniref:SIMPL domain-containing protein n=1 Tax=Microbulbifer sp. SAOS-129_SWC TaxID=3145235 RepID=UPI0032175CDA
MKVVNLTLIALLALVTAACGDDNDKHERGTLVSISATGEASRVPDVANISAGVVTQSADSKQAMADNAAQMKTLMKAIKKAGIDDKDVQTSGISLFPHYVTNRSGDGKTEIDAYNARNTVNIKVRKLDKLGEVLDALTAAGANQIHGPSLEIGKPAPVMAEARQQALDKARARAEAYADSLDMKVRRIVSISESGNRAVPRPMMMEMARAKTADTATPVAPGETTVSVNLDLVFELED